MRGWLVGVGLAALSGCMGVPLVQTPASIVWAADGRLKTCTVSLGWTVAELGQTCGQPLGELAWAGGKRCFLYPSLARPFIGEPGAAAFAVCTSMQSITPHGRRKTGTAYVRTPEEDVEYVDAVFALNAMPEIPPAP